MQVPETPEILARRSLSHTLQSPLISTVVVDWQREKNLLLLLKLSVLQGENEEIIHSVYGTTIDGRMEHPVILVISTSTGNLAHSIFR